MLCRWINSDFALLSVISESGKIMSHNTWRRWVSRLFKSNSRTRVRKLRRPLRLEPLEDRVVPTTDTWTGLGVGLTSKDWSNVGNWSLGRAPVSGDTVVFPTITNGNLSPIYNLATNPALNSINISGAGYTLSGQGSGVLIVTNGVSVGAGLATINVTQSLELLPPGSAPQESITVNAGSVLNMTAPLVAASNVTTSKIGAGTLILNSASPSLLGTFTLGNSGSPTG